MQAHFIREPSHYSQERVPFWVSWSSMPFLDGQFPEQVRNLTPYIVYYFYTTAVHKGIQNGFTCVDM